MTARANNRTDNQQVNLYLNKRGFRNYQLVQEDLLLRWAEELREKKLKTEKWRGNKDNFHSLGDGVRMRSLHGLHAPWMS